jgi:hypothetical protein
VEARRDVFGTHGGGPAARSDFVGTHVGGPAARSDFFGTHVGGPAALSDFFGTHVGGPAALSDFFGTHVGGPAARPDFFGTHVGGPAALVSAEIRPTQGFEHRIVIELLAALLVEHLARLAKHHLGLGPDAEPQRLAHQPRIDRIVGQIALAVASHRLLDLAHVKISGPVDPHLLGVRRGDPRELAGLREVQVARLQCFGQLGQLRQRVGHAQTVLRGAKAIAELVRHVVREARVTELAPQLKTLRLA